MQHDRARLIPDSKLTEVANIYRQGLEIGETGRRWVASHYRCSFNTASMWINEAERRGLLTAEEVNQRRSAKVYPFQNLEAHLQKDLLEATLFKQLGITRNTVNLYRETGLTARQADTFAIRAGTHPGRVWPDLWWRDSA